MIFNTRKGAEKGNVLTKGKLREGQSALNMNMSVKDIGIRIGVKPDTLRKAIQPGRLRDLFLKKQKKWNKQKRHKVNGINLMAKPHPVWHVPMNKAG